MLAALVASAVLTSTSPVLLEYGSNPRISPDGKSIAYVMPGVRRVAVMTINGQVLGTSFDIPEVAPPRPGSQKRRTYVHGVEWSGNSKRLFVIHSVEDLITAVDGWDYWFFKVSYLSSWNVSLTSAPLLSGRKELEASSEEMHMTIRRDNLGSALTGVSRQAAGTPKELSGKAFTSWIDSQKFRVYIHRIGNGTTTRTQNTGHLGDVKLLPLEQGMLTASSGKAELKTQKGKPFKDDGYSRYIDASVSGDVIAYERNGNIKIYRRSTEVTTEINLEAVCHNVDGLSISSDGKTIVFSGFEINNGEDTYKTAVYKIAIGG